MKKLTSSVYTFKDLIGNNFLYVDKTEYIWSLIEPGKEMYFLSRPRRFGKSLTISTLEAVFNGEKELFKGLAIYNKDYDWKKYPVIHIDMGNCNAQTPKELETYLFSLLDDIAAQFGVECRHELLSNRFEALVADIAKQGDVVILIDEYDKPILGNVSNPCISEILKVLKGFYSGIKKCEPYERFVFLTGVSKFAHVSIFSDLNNLTDITMMPDYASLVGYTQDELEKYFGDRIDIITKQQNISRQELLGKLKQWYNGYRFEETAETVYNPVSIAQFFNNNGKFNNYWFDTGTPTFLLELAKKTEFSFENALTRPVSGMVFKSYEIDQLDALALLVQTGYLTIKGTEQKYGKTFYYLRFPNLEVDEAFNVYLLSNYVNTPKEAIDDLSVSLADKVVAGDVDGFMELLKGFFQNVPYSIHVSKEKEKYYQTIFFVLFLLLGIHIEAESCTNKGRIDAVASCGDWTYLFEFKMDQSAEIALNQIKDKEYFGKYLHTGKRIMMIGVNFDSETGEITGWQKEELV